MSVPIVRRLTKRIGLLLFMCYVTLTLYAQPLKYEFRSVWVATVANIDWPSSPGLSVDAQKEEVTEILNRHKSNGMNAVILQVRPTSDAIYKSDIEPWSKYLKGDQLFDSTAVFDPLEYWIDEAHKRGMELHAWFNPYRIKQNMNDPLADGHIALLHPEWTFNYGNKTYFEPGIPEVWDFVTSVVVDVVSRYDIDAVHFDDYFYPYQIRGEEIPDDSVFSIYGGAYYPDRLADWRRHNVDTIIHQLSVAIKETKPWVKFGISPFGVWRNRSIDALGSETQAGTTNYEGLYADVLLWQREGWIDYLMPQLYWRDDHPAVAFSTLAYWWNDYSYGRSVYVGLGPYKIDKQSDYKLWKKDKHMLQQIDILRDLDAIDGYGMFSSKHFLKAESKGMNKRLKRRYAVNEAIVPPMPWIDHVPPACPQNLRVQGERLCWDSPEADDEMNRQRFFVVYRFDKEADRFLKKASLIVAVCGENELLFKGGIPSGIYRVAALDRLNNESQLSTQIMVD